MQFVFMIQYISVLDEDCCGQLQNLLLACVFVCSTLIITECDCFIYKELWLQAIEYMEIKFSFFSDGDEGGIILLICQLIYSSGVSRLVNSAETANVSKSLEYLQVYRSAFFLLL